MTWTIKSINLGSTPNREGTTSYDTEAAFESAVRQKLVDLKTQVISATLHDGTDLEEAELRKRYRNR
jgi:hypothetical protein